MASRKLVGETLDGRTVGLGDGGKSAGLINQLQGTN